jgi:hypothetical protein
VLVSQKITLGNSYNIDETGFRLGVEESTRVIVDTTMRTRYKAQLGRQKWVSVVEAICADGTILPLSSYSRLNTLIQYRLPPIHQTTGTSDVTLKVGRIMSMV